MKGRWGVVAVVGVAVCLLALWAAVGSGKLRGERTTSHYCIECGTDRLVHETWANGTWVHESTELTPSRSFFNFLGEAHEHEWVLNCVTTKTATSESIGCGMNAMPNRFTCEYDWNDGFRAFVDEQIASGALTRERAARIVVLRSLDGASPEARTGAALCEQHFGKTR